MTSANPPSDRPKRRVELDFLRGLALIIMTTGHPLRADVYGDHVTVDFIRLVYNHYGELFSGLFMFVSGINVTNFLASAARTPDLDATRFYVKSSIALFLMGWTYNLCVGTAMFVDIIQAIALGTLVTYLFLSWRMPTWGFAAFTLLMFLAAPVLVGPGPMTDETMRRIDSYYYFVAFFGPIPWLGYFTFGVAVDRIRGRRAQNAVMAVGAAVFVFSHFLPELRGTEPAVHLLKANARYLVMSAGLLPILLFGAGRLYKGVSKLGREIEYWGAESLVFLVFHWIYIFYLGIVFHPIYLRFGDTFTAWLTSACTMAIMAATVHPIARLRDRWTRSKNFSRRAWFVFGAAMLGWMMFMGRLVKLASYSGVQVYQLKLPEPSLTPVYSAFFFKQNFAFLTAMTFCFLYPYLRTQFRKASMRPSQPK